jgi:uncharacterized protein
MPKVVLTEDITDKKFLLLNYISDYVNKDIRYIGKLDNILKFNQLIKLLATQIGNLLNINELANTLNIKRTEIEFYITLLENSFLIYRIYPYYTNIRSQISKMPKIYFFDSGIRNQILNNFLDLPHRLDNGSLFENFVYLELKNSLRKENIYFYRTIHKAEIDFILEKDGLVYPVEVKYKYFAKPACTRVLHNFSSSKDINSPQGYVVNLNLDERENNIQYISFTNLNF